ncbi:MAG: DUF6537 domain-containing protein, partial [Gammaproteobacteria bacterium]
ADPAAFAAVVESVTRPAADGVPGLTTAGAAAAAGIIASIGALEGSELARLVGVRVPDLVAYQDAAYARAYAEVVHGLVDGDPRLAEAVAIGLHKLMAYKDEYEVARLYVDGGFAAQLAERFEGGYRLEFHLAPPLLAKKNERGELVKQSYGPWMRTAFTWLAKLKGLRGTALDPFGRTEERRTERALIGEYEALVKWAAARLTPATSALCVELAEL